MTINKCTKTTVVPNNNSNNSTTSNNLTFSTTQTTPTASTTQTNPHYMDVHNPDTRSYNMSQIKGRDTQPELMVRKFLFSKGLRYRLYDKKLPGKPDIILPKYKTIIMVHGCFWHGHEGCKYFVIPKTRTEWWTEKINKNKANDEKNEIGLIALGWKMIKVFGCELQKDKKETTLQHILESIIH